MEKLSEIKALYKFYHKRFWCYKKAFKHFKRLNLIINVSSTSLVVIGSIVGGVTLNPIILGTISGIGILLKTFSEAKNYQRKIKMCKFAYTSYEKILTDLWSFLRGLEFDNKQFLDYIKIVDDITIDICPLTDKFEDKYNKMFIVK